MPIVVRRASEPPNGFSPSAVLLPAVGTLDAVVRRLLGRFEDPARYPPAWLEPRFVREVGLVRSHLAPIRSRVGLAASFSREAFQRVDDRDEQGATPDAPGAVAVAYALRWLELRDGLSRPPWPATTERVALDA